MNLDKFTTNVRKAHRGAPVTMIIGNEYIFRVVDPTYTGNAIYPTVNVEARPATTRELSKLFDGELHTIDYDVIKFKRLESGLLKTTQVARVRKWVWSATRMLKPLTPLQAACDDALSALTHGVDVLKYITNLTLEIGGTVAINGVRLDMELSVVSTLNNVMVAIRSHIHTSTPSLLTELITAIASGFEIANIHLLKDIRSMLAKAIMRAVMTTDSIDRGAARNWDLTPSEYMASVYGVRASHPGWEARVYEIYNTRIKNTTPD